MTTYKFLAKGALGPQSGFAWPVPEGGLPGAWVEVTGPLAACARGVHVCRPVDLAHWVHDELWEVEADGDPIDGLDCVVVPRGRLVRRIEAWNDRGAPRFAEACIEHAVVATGEDTASGAALVQPVRELLDDARSMATHGYFALAAFTAAFAVGRADANGSRENAYRRERAWQSAWIADELLRPL